MSTSFISPRRTWWSLLFATLIAVACAVGLVAAPSHADDTAFPAGYPRTSANLPSDEGYRLVFGSQSIPTHLFRVSTGPSTDPLRAYCIESTVSARHDHELKLVAWTQFPGNNAFRNDAQVRARVAWVVRNSYPQMSIESLRTAAGLPGLTEKEAISATQAALWQLTDGLVATGVADAQNPESGQRVLALVTHLTGPKNTGLDPESGPAVSIQAPTEPGVAGEPVGPFRITANVPTVTIESAGRPVIDAEGRPVDPAAVPTGVDLFLQVGEQEPAGSTTLTVTATGARHVGSLLVSAHERTQTIVVVDSESVSVRAEAVVHWNQAPVPSPSPTPTATPTPSPSPTPTASRARRDHRRR